MNLHTELSEFNRCLANALLPEFGPDIRAMQSGEGVLYFRGPIPVPEDPNHVGSHVAVSLAPDVRAALDQASSTERAEMTENLIESLGGQIRAQYNPNKHGEFALDFVGTMGMVTG